MDDQVQDIVKGLAETNITDEDGKYNPDNEQEEPEGSKIDRIFSDNKQKIYTQIDEKVKEVVKKVREFGDEMKDEAWQYLEDRKKGIESTADIEHPKYLGISFEEETTTKNRIQALFGTILPCAGKIITQEQRDEFKKLPEQIVQDFNCEDLTEDVSQLSSTKETDKGFSWSFMVKKQDERLDFRPIITNLKPEEGPLNHIIHFRIYLIWDNEPQRYLQMVITEDEPEYQKLLDWEELTNQTDPFKIRCIMQIVDQRAQDELQELTFPDGGKQLREDEKNDYNLTVNTILIRIEHSFTCEWFNANVNKVIKLRSSTTDLGFSLGFEVKRSSKFLRVRPFISDKEVPFKPIIHFKFYLIWKDEPQYYLKMDRKITQTNLAFHNLIFWEELIANTDAHAHAPDAPDANTTGQFKIRCVLQNADERVPLTPKK